MSRWWISLTITLAIGPFSKVAHAWPTLLAHYCRAALETMRVEVYLAPEAANKTREAVNLLQEYRVYVLNQKEVLASNRDFDPSNPFQLARRIRGIEEHYREAINIDGGENRPQVFGFAIRGDSPESLKSIREYLRAYNSGAKDVAKQVAGLRITLEAIQVALQSLVYFTLYTRLHQLELPIPPEFLSIGVLADLLIPYVSRVGWQTGPNMLELERRAGEKPTPGRQDLSSSMNYQMPTDSFGPIWKDKTQPEPFLETAPSSWDGFSLLMRPLFNFLIARAQIASGNPPAIYILSDHFLIHDSQGTPTLIATLRILNSAPKDQHVSVDLVKLISELRPKKKVQVRGDSRPRPLPPDPRVR